MPDDAMTALGAAEPYRHATEAIEQFTSLEAAIQRAEDALLALQHPTGYWCFELEADSMIPAEYIMMMHYMGEIDTELQRKLANYLRAHQLADGG